MISVIDWMLTLSCSIIFVYILSLLFCIKGTSNGFKSSRISLINTDIIVLSKNRWDYRSELSLTLTIFEFVCPLDLPHSFIIWLFLFEELNGIDLKSRHLMFDNWIVLSTATCLMYSLLNLKSIDYVFSWVEANLFKGKRLWYWWIVFLERTYLNIFI